MNSQGSSKIPSIDDALPGRDIAIPVADKHVVLEHPLQGPFPKNMQVIMFGMGCFWGAEKMFWQMPGVYSTAVGYAAGSTPNPTYQEVCSGQTGHNEVVRVVFDPQLVSFSELLTVFWEGHDPTQGMRQGNDRGTQYRSGIYVNDELQQQQAEQTLKHFQARLTAAGYQTITTEIRQALPFYFAEDYHQQYLAKNANGYCGMGGIGVSFSD